MRIGRAMLVIVMRVFVIIMIVMCVIVSAGLAGSQREAGGRIDKAKGFERRADLLDERLLKRDAGGEVQPGLAQRGHLSRRRLEDVRRLSRADHDFDVEMLAGDSLREVGLRQDADEDAGPCIGRAAGGRIRPACA